MFRPKFGHQEKSGRSPRTSGAPFLARKDSDHAERKLPQISPAQARIRGQIAGSADISFLICHLEAVRSDSRFLQVKSDDIHFRWRRRHVRLNNVSIFTNPREDKHGPSPHYAEWRTTTRLRKEFQKDIISIPGPRMRDIRCKVRS